MAVSGLFGSDPNSQVREVRTEPLELGEVIISKLDSLDDLKIHVMAFPEMEDVAVPTTQFLRVRLVEDKRLTTVLKGSSQSLQ